MLDIVTENDITIIKFKKHTRFSYVISQSVKDDISILLNNSHAKIILNFKGIEFIDSSGIGALIYLLKISKQKSGKFVFCNVSKEVLDLLEVMQLQSIFEIYPTIDEAITKIS